MHGLRALLLTVILVGCDVVEQQADKRTEESSSGKGLSINYGQRMYRNGISPTGKPLAATVAGDVPVLGTQFSCESCHGRSGMGVTEGAYIVPPIAGQFLFASSPQPKRPAYTKNSLGELLKSGVTPGGRLLSELMPRYDLNDKEVGAISAYLAKLSSRPALGVDEQVIRFATVITEDVSTEESDAVMSVLTTFIEDKNSDTRLESERWDRGHTPSSRLSTVHRNWLLDKWVLTGPSETWDAQLERYYQREPVFAMLSGLSHVSWQPISNFCERNHIPCLLPSTDLPSFNEGDFYTLYYSQGLILEARLIADQLSKQDVTRVVQVYCDSGPTQAVESLDALLNKQAVLVENIGFNCDEMPPIDLSQRTVMDKNTTTIFWLASEQLEKIVNSSPLGQVYFSSTLLAQKLNVLQYVKTEQAFVAHPYRMPGAIDTAMTRFKVWARARGIEVSSPRRQSEAFFACLAMKEAVTHMGRFFIRDYVLDILDHAQSLAVYLPAYPRPTLGPRQRFLNKGGYVLPLVNGRVDTRSGDWISL